MNSTFKRKPPKPKKCQLCRDKPVMRLGAKACSPECAEKYVEQQKEKKQRAEAKQIRRIDKERKEKLKSRSDYLKETQIEVNRYIRARDANLPCISCGRNSGHKVNAGHYLSVGARPHLRFCEDNINLQCEHCNTYLSGNQIAYRMGLIKKIGLEAVEALEADNTPRKWTISELKAIKQEYKDKLKSLLKQRQDLPHD